MGSRLSGGMRDGLASQECHNTYQGELRISLSFSSCSSTIVGLLEPPQSPHPRPGVQLTGGNRQVRTTDFPSLATGLPFVIAVATARGRLLDEPAKADADSAKQEALEAKQ